VVKIEGFNLQYLPYKEGQENIISELIWNVFEEFEAPDYTVEGVKTFKEYIRPDYIRNRVKNEGFKLYCCLDGKRIVGIIAFRNITHISLLFVEKSYHEKGIAKELLKISIEDIQKFNPDVVEITVNSSPYAVKIYKKLGFVSTDIIQMQNGIIYTPMKKMLC
jgi:ribosomal protein S18 acetylase RimI-like enzyme